MLLRLKSAIRYRLISCRKVVVQHNDGPWMDEVLRTGPRQRLDCSARRQRCSCRKGQAGLCVGQNDGRPVDRLAHRRGSRKVALVLSRNSTEV
jgi:hypothetical protein